MESYQIQELINKVESNQREIFLIYIEKTGHIELTRSQVLNILKNEYITSTMNEFNDWIKANRINQAHICREFNISRFQFNQMINNKVRSINKISALDIVKKIKETL